MTAVPLRPVLALALAAGLAAGTPPGRGLAAAQSQTPPALAPAAASQTAPPSARVDDLFRPWQRPGSPGAAVLVVRDGRVLHAAGYGLANLEHGIPNGTATVFDVASVSKQFAAFAIALLGREGSIDLDDDVRRYLPELPDFGDTIRIRHLLHHTSGLRDWPVTLRLAGWDWTDVLSFQQILAMAFHQRELNFAPGTEHAYSNTGYNLMAEIVARVTGRSFREWTRDRIFEPLGMHDTHFHDDWTAVVPRRADSYQPADGGFRRVPSNLTAQGSSSLFTTIDDLARWAVNFDEPVVGDAALMDRILERGVLSHGDTIRYASGLGIDRYRGVRTASHTGSWAGYRSIFLRFPDHRLTIAILGNVSDVGSSELAHRIADIYLADALDPSPPSAVATGTTPGRAPGGSRTGAPSPAAAGLTLDDYAGPYLSAELFTGYEIRVEGGELVAWHFRTGTTRLLPAGPDVFLVPDWGRIEFLRGPDGTVTAFTVTNPRVRGLRFDRR
jgi:CubicO group peptidase (beta-lactamase class C family)